MVDEVMLNAMQVSSEVSWMLLLLCKSIFLSCHRMFLNVPSLSSRVSSAAARLLLTPSRWGGSYVSFKDALARALAAARAASSSCSVSGATSG